MRRDVGFYVDASVDKVYQAYLEAATHAPFERTCSQEPYHTISFGVNFSFKYNMNGGACHIHFMPSGSGTAVNMRFSIAQGAGARYEKYAQDLNAAMMNFLPVMIRPTTYNMDDFLKPENQVVPAQISPVIQPAPVAAPVTQSSGQFCSNCGNPLNPVARFCSQCGTAVAPANKVCSACQTPANSEDIYCSNCGTRL